MKIGLALSGGGVKGAAHIGVIKALEENGIKIDVIAGTSIGSIVASLYAMGYTTEEMLKLFKYLSKEIMKTSPRRLVGNLKATRLLLGNGLISSENIEIAIEECAKQKQLRSMNEIKIPISIPTVNIVNSKKYVFTNMDFKEDYYIKNAPIAKAVCASSSYPRSFFTMRIYGK